MKKILSALLVLAMVIGCLSMSVFAAGNTTMTGSEATYVIGSEDKSVTVTFTVDSATYNSYEFTLQYNKEYFELTALENCGPGSVAVSLKNAMIAMAHSEDVTHAGVLVKATFTVKDGVVAGEYPVNIDFGSSYIAESRKEGMSVADQDLKVSFTPALIIVEDAEIPTEEPTEAPTEEPTEAPTEEPTEAPTEEPTEAPTEEPTEAPTEEPTEAPTEEPTEAPTEEPTEAPTEKPTEPGKDPVPETGDITAPFVMAGTLVLVMMAAAFFFVTKRQTAK